MSRTLPLLSLSLASSLVCTSLMLPLPARAGAPEAEAPAEVDAEAAVEGEAPAPEDPALAEARELYKQGKISFDTGEYNAALALWKQAFGILPDGEDTRTIRHDLAYNIAEAHTRAYEVSRNPTHLRTAKVMLESYRKDHLVLYGDDEDAVAERAEVDDRIAELDKKIEASVEANEQAYPLEQGATVPTTTDDGQQPAPAPGPKPLTPQQQWEKELKADPELGPRWQKANKKVVTGAVLAGIGGTFAIGGLVLMAGGVGAAAAPDIGDLDPSLDPGIDTTPTDGGLLLVSGAVVGVIGLGLLIPGGIFLGKGMSERKRVLAAKPRPTSSLAPSFSPRGAGFHYTLRF